MDYLNVHVPLLRSDLFADASPEDLGVWLRLSAYCAQQENGGQIIACAEWSDHKWLMTVGIRKADLDRQSTLWTWANSQPGVLWVTGYPKEQEAKLKAQRKGGKIGAKRRWNMGQNGTRNHEQNGVSE